MSLLTYLIEGCRFDGKATTMAKQLQNHRAEPRFAIQLRNVCDHVTDGLPRTIIQRKHGIAVFSKQPIFIIHQSSNSLGSFEKNRIK